MKPIGYIMMYGWFFAVVPALFVFLPRRTAAFSGLIFGSLFLPWQKVHVFGPIDISRAAAVSVSVLICMVFLDTDRLLRLRPRLIDLPMAVWVVTPFMSSVLNGLGVYDGGAMIVNHMMDWGLPYIIGRAYITDAKALRHLAMILLIGGLAYVPFILWEIRMSPRLHEQIYGFRTYTHGGTALRRLGGYRPLVFLRHGLMLGVFISAAALIGLWLWHTRSLRSIPLLPPGLRREEAGAEEKALPAWPFVWGLLLIAIACRALNGMALMAMGAAALLSLKHMKTRVPLLLMISVPFLYAAVRLSEPVTGFAPQEPLLAAVESISSDRAGSLRFRFRNEQLLAEKALEQPLFGWGGWGRNRVYDEEGNDLTVTDGYWIITLGQKGLVGLMSLFFAMLGPVYMLVLRYKPEHLCSPEGAAAVGLGVVVTMFMIDCMPNAMLSPMYPLMSGGIAGLLVALESRPRPRSPAARPAQLEFATHGA